MQEKICYKIVLIIASSLLFTSCATEANGIKSSYVSESMYRDYSCSQLQGEALRVSGRALELSGQQDNQARNDAIAVGASLLFWPAVFLVGGNKATAEEVSRLKGEMNAIQQQAIEKKCKFRFDIR